MIRKSGFVPQFLGSKDKGLGIVVATSNVVLPNPFENLSGEVKGNVHAPRLIVEVTSKGGSKKSFSSFVSQI